MVNSSAPGKIILFGEHAVVYGRPALAVPVNQVQARVSVDKNSRGGVWVEAPNIDLSSALASLPPGDPLAAVIRGVLSTLGIARPPACTICVQSTIPVAAGLGSGAAVSVAVIRALSAFLGRPFTDEQVNDLAFEIEKIHHGTPSGIDNTVVTFARPVYFIKGHPLQTFRIASPFTLIIGDTGTPAPTKDSVGDVRRLWQADPPRWEQVFDRIGEVAWQARQAMERGDLATLGAQMDANHALLQELTVSSPALDHLVEAARLAGALGAKLSGSGRGGNMIALVETENAPAVSGALRVAGVKHSIVTRVG